MNKNSVIHIRIPQNIKEELKEEAHKWDMSLSTLCLKKIKGESWQTTELSHLQRELYKLRGTVAKQGGLYKADLSVYQGLDPRKAELKKAILSNQSCQSKINEIIDKIYQNLGGAL